MMSSVDSAMELSSDIKGLTDVLSGTMPFLAFGASTVSAILIIYFVVSIVMKIHNLKQTIIMRNNIKEIRATLEAIKDYGFSDNPSQPESTSQEEQPQNIKPVITEEIIAYV